MRRLLTLALVGASFALGAPAHAAPVCAGDATAGVCADVWLGCPGPCVGDVVDPYCHHNDPRILACDEVDSTWVGGTTPIGH